MPDFHRAMMIDDVIIDLFSRGEPVDMGGLFVALNVGASAADGGGPTSDAGRDVLIVVNAELYAEIEGDC